MALPSCEGEMSLALLVAPGAATQAVEDDDVAITSIVKTGVEVQGQVVTVVAQIDWEAASGMRRHQLGQTQPSQEHTR